MFFFLVQSYKININMFNSSLLLFLEISNTFSTAFASSDCLKCSSESINRTLSMLKLYKLLNEMLVLIVLFVNRL